METNELLGFPTIRLYDISGQDISEDMEKYLTYKSQYSSGKGKAELFMMYVSCFVLLSIGYIIYIYLKE